jgi:hypothetical protein
MRDDACHALKRVFGDHAYKLKVRTHIYLYIHTTCVMWMHFMTDDMERCVVRARETDGPMHTHTHTYTHTSLTHTHTHTLPLYTHTHTHTRTGVFDQVHDGP